MKIPDRIASYADCLQGSEVLILEAFCFFFDEFECIKKTNIVDIQRFGPDVIRKKWIDLLLCKSNI